MGGLDTVGDGRQREGTGEGEGKKGKERGGKGMGRGRAREGKRVGVGTLEEHGPRGMLPGYRYGVPVAIPPVALPGSNPR